MSIETRLSAVKATLKEGVKLVAVSKYHPVEALQKAYEGGQRIFGESHVQELMAKQQALPDDIEWHFIGHLQTNKVKYIASFVSLIHSVDSMKLLKEIDKQANKAKRRIDVLLQLHVAAEDSKFGFSPTEVVALLESNEWRTLEHVHIIGLMAMATNTEDAEQIGREFESVKTLFYSLKARFFADNPSFKELSMGMSGDYPIALQHGSTMVRVGSLIFGEREYNQPPRL